ncbi:MAG: hypothetical protein HQL59_13590, partial [Magnetococcales bacterium]|nr:hypothetical protein [Magnetococcales bacterium]
MPNPPPAAASRWLAAFFRGLESDSYTVCTRIRLGGELAAAGTKNAQGNGEDSREGGTTREESLLSTALLQECRR